MLNSFHRNLSNDEKDIVVYISGHAKNLRNFPLKLCCINRKLPQNQPQFEMINFQNKNYRLSSSFLATKTLQIVLL